MRLMLRKLREDPFLPGQVRDPAYLTLGFLPRKTEGKNAPFPISKRVARVVHRLGLQLPQEWHYGYMRPTALQGVRAGRRFLNKLRRLPDDRLVQLICAYIKNMIPELEGSCAPCEIGEVIINPKGTAGPSFPGQSMASAIREHPDLISIPHYKMGSLILWKMAGKYEILPISKIHGGEPRTFCFLDFHHKIRWTRLVQEFNKTVQTLKDRRPPAGSISLVEDWHDFWTEMDRYVNKVSSDFRKYDSCYQPLFHEVMCQLRLWAFSPEVSDEDRAELRFYYDDLQQMHVVLPNGQVVLLDCGQPSGQPSTTTDNSIIAAFLIDLAFSVLAHYQDGQGSLGSALVEAALANRHPSCRSQCIIKTGGDDSTSASNLNLDDYLPALNAVCEYFGFEVKMEEFFQTRDVTKCGFLGGRACKVGGYPSFDPSTGETRVRGGRFVYTPKDPVKMYESMFLDKGGLSGEEEYLKLMSLTALSWNTVYFGRCYQLYSGFYDEFRREFKLEPPATKRQFRNFWMRGEAVPLAGFGSCYGSLDVMLHGFLQEGGFSNFYLPSTLSQLLQ